MRDPMMVRTNFEVAADPPPSEPQYPIHVVGRFESLRGIARDRLGDPRRASEIVALNRNVVSSINDRLVAGQNLRLPRDATKRRTWP
jgi:nucleoid-associated protein YgaU